RKIACRVISEVLVDGRGNGECRGLHQDRITIGIGLGDGRGANRTSGTDTVFDDNRLTKLARELIEDHARSDVGAATCRIWHNCADWPCWPRLCAGLCGRYRDGENRQQRQANPFHDVLSPLVLTCVPASAECPQAAPAPTINAMNYGLVAIRSPDRRAPGLYRGL